MTERVRHGSRADVAVVGLGLAGLRAAELLVEAGLRPRCFDAASAVGGRIATVRDAAGRPLFEAGAEWIDGDHRRMLALTRRAGLRLVDGGAPALQLLVDSRAEAEAVRVESEALALAQSGALPRGGTVLEHLRLAARSPAAAALLAARFRSDEGDDLERVGLAGWLVGLRQYVARGGDEPSSFRVAEGLSTLCERVASSLPGPLYLGHALAGVAQDERGVDLHFVDRPPVRADRIVLALPIGVLQRLALPLPEPQNRAFAGLACGRACKLMLRFRRPFWRRAGWGRSVLLDSPLQEIWDASLGEVSALCAYTVGEAASSLAAQADPCGIALRELSRHFSDAPDEFLGGELHTWLGDARPGPHAYIPPLYACELLPWRQRPWGRVHFAGEHTATWIGFMEGAVESAERVAAEILAATGAHHCDTFM